MKKYPLRFTDDQEHLFDAIKESARKNHRSFNAEVLRALEHYLKNAPEAQHETKEVKPKKSPQ